MARSESSVIMLRLLKVQKTYEMIQKQFYLYLRNVHECTNESKHNLDKYSPPVFKIPEGYHQILLQSKPKKTKGE